MKQTKKLVSALLVLALALLPGVCAAAADLPEGYNWVEVPVSPDGLNEGDFYLDLTSLPLVLLLHQNDEAYSEEAATAAGMLGGAWYADHGARVVYGEYSCLDADGATQTVTVEPSMDYYALVKQVEAHHWETVPKSTEGLTKGDCFVNMQTLQSMTGDEALFAVLQTAAFQLDYDNFAFRVVGDYNGTPFEVSDVMWLFALEEYEAEWIPVHFYTEELNEGDWYMDFDEEAALMFEMGIYPTDGTTDGPHIRAMYERVGNANAFYVNANRNSRLFRYKTQTTTPAYYPLLDLMGYNPTMNYTERFDRSIRRYYPEEYHWVSIPTSPEGLEKGECYLDFSFKIKDSRPENKETILAMYNEGAWEIDYDKMVLRGSIDIPPEIYPHEQWYHMIYDPSPYLLQFALREKDVNWVPLRYGPDGCSDGEWYLDIDGFVDAVGSGKSEAEKNEVRSLITQHVVFKYNPGGRYFKYRFEYTDLPVEGGAPVSGSVDLPIGMLWDEDAFIYDYNALKDCVRQYNAPDVPDEPEQPEENENWFRRHIVGPLRSAISSILSFFRRLFGLMR